MVATPYDFPWRSNRESCGQFILSSDRRRMLETTQRRHHVVRKEAKGSDCLQGFQLCHSRTQLRHRFRCGNASDHEGAGGATRSHHGDVFRQIVGGAVTQRSAECPSARRERGRAHLQSFVPPRVYCDQRGDVMHPLPWSIESRSVETCRKPRSFASLLLFMNGLCASHVSSPRTFHAKSMRRAADSRSRSESVPGSRLKEVLQSARTCCRLKEATAGRHQLTMNCVRPEAEAAHQG